MTSSGPSSSSSVSAMLSSTLNGGNNSTIAQEVRERLAQAARELALQRSKAASSSSQTTAAMITTSVPISTILSGTNSIPAASRVERETVDIRKAVEEQSSGAQRNEEQSWILPETSNRVSIPAERKPEPTQASKAKADQEASTDETHEDTAKFHMKDGNPSTGLTGLASVPLSAVIQRPPATPGSQSAALAAASSHKTNTKQRDSTMTLVSPAPSPNSDQSSLTVVSSEGGKEAAGRGTAGNNGLATLPVTLGGTVTERIRSVPSGRTDEEGKEDDIFFEEQVMVGEFSLYVTRLPNRLLKKIVSVETSLFSEDIGGPEFFASAEPHTENETTISALTNKKKRGRPPKTSSATAGDLKRSRTPSSNVRNEVLKDSSTLPDAQAAVPQKKSRAVALTGKTSAKETELRGQQTGQLEELDAKKKQKRVTISEPSETTSSGPIRFQTSRMGRRTSRPSSSTTAAIIPNTQISESDLEQLMNRVANAVQMIQEILWPQYSTLESPRPEPSAQLASSYWNALTSVLRKQQNEPEMLDRVERAMRDLTEGKATHAEVMFEVAFALAVNDKLLMGFDIFLPSELSMTNLLVFQKLVVALVHVFDPAAVTEKKRQRDSIRKAMDELIDAFQDDIWTSPPPLVPKQPPKALQPGKDSVTGPEKGSNPNMMKGSNWINTLLKKYGDTAEGEKLCRRVLKTITALVEPNGTPYGRKKLLDYIRGILRNDQELKTSFEAFAQTLV